MRSVPRTSYTEVSLESLVSNPEEVTRHLCDFWEIPWHDSLMETGLSGSNTGRWKNEFSRDQQRRIEKILEHQLEQLGYA